MPSIVDNSTKPYAEWIGGKPVQKVTPDGPHALAHTRIAAALLQWAESCGAGRVGTEWDFVITPPSYDRIPYGDDDAARIPRVAPDVAFEILSPNDLRRNVDENDSRLSRERNTGRH